MPWTNGEKAIRDVGRKIEDGNQNDARKESTHSTELYREAELLAIRTDILGSAKAEAQRARELGADNLAALTMAGGDTDLQTAEQILQGDRYMKAQARDLANSARNQFRHASLIAEAATKIDQDRKGAPETMILAYEGEISRIASALGYEPEFAEGSESVVDQVVAAVNSLVADREQLVQEVTELHTEMEHLNDRLATLEDRDQELQQKERQDRKLRDVREMFDWNQAEVPLGDDQLIIRLYGLSFPVGSSEIRPQNFALLTQLQRALREFPASTIGIEGHTDSQGDENLNQSLSERRAEAVREYLVANLALDPERIVARGYGESRPIANNENESGRARNRRIDVVVELSVTEM